MASRLVVVAAFLALLAGVSVAGVGAGQSDAADDVRLVDLATEDEEYLWPYTSRRPSFEARTLAINLIVYDDPESVEHRLRRQSDETWGEHNDTTANFSLEVEEDRVRFVWAQAHGSQRYSYVERDGEGTWLLQRYQLHTGAYLGERRHVRAYAPSLDSEWTAIQAHSEYWDWFRLRHTVTDVWETGRSLESDFADQPHVTDVERTHRTDRGPHSDGITVVHAAVGAALALAAQPVRRRVESVGDRLAAVRTAEPGSLGLLAFALAVPVVVRVTGVAAEAALGGVNPKVIAAPLYAFLVLGLPVGVYRLGETVEGWRGFVLAAVGFLAGSAIDFVALGVVAVPPRAVTHRLVLAAALGTVGAGDRGQDLGLPVLVAGFAAWWGTCMAIALGLL